MKMQTCIMPRFVITLNLVYKRLICYSTYMAHAVAFVAIRTTKTREHFAESSYTTQLRVQTMHNTRIVLPVASTIARAEIFLGCWRDLPFLNRTHFVFDQVIPMGRQKATRPDSDEDCIRIGEFPCYSHYAERLARLKQVPIFKVLAQPYSRYVTISTKHLWQNGVTENPQKTVKLSRYKWNKYAISPHKTCQIINKSKPGWK